MTYTEIKAALASWLDNDEISETDIDTFILLTEAKMNRTLRTMNQIEQFTFTAVDEGEYYDLPTDFIGARQISVNGFDQDYLTPEQMDGVYFNQVTNGRPCYYTVINNKVRFKPITNADSDIVMWYYKKIPPIKTNLTNWVSEGYEDAYLYGGLSEANLFLYDDAKAQRYGQLFASVINSMDRADKADRWSGSSMITRIVL